MRWPAFTSICRKKAKQAEITTRALDLRGLFGAIGTMRQGLSPYLAVQIGIVNKCFDLFEKRSCGMSCARGFRKSGRRRIFFRGNTYGDRGNIKNA